MNLKKWLPLTVRTLDFNLVAKQPSLISKLRKLTLGAGSGLNYELTRMLADAQERTVNCKVILAHQFRDLIGWAILSKESTDFFFYCHDGGFKGDNGWMFQIFVNPSHRRGGVGSKIYRTAQRIVGYDLIHISPWDDTSKAFYATFPNINEKYLV